MEASLVRRRALIASALLLPGAIAACGGGTTKNSGGSDAGSDAASSSLPRGEGKTRYPLELVTPHGKTTLEKRPEKIAVVAGLQDLEALLALGGIPVISDTISWPWQKKAVGEHKVQQFDIWSDAGLPFEKILAAAPDAILACSYADLDKDYKKLADIAPVVALENVPAADTWKADWRDIQRTIGTALDLAGKADDAVRATEEAISRTAAEHPSWKGKSLSFVMNRGESAGITVTNVHGTSVEHVAEAFGFAPQPHADELLATEGDVSPEQLQLIDAGVLVIAQHGGSGTSADAKKWLASNQLYQQLGAVRAGKVVEIEPDADGELPLAWAFDYPNALSTPWLIDQFTSLVKPIIG